MRKAGPNLQYSLRTGCSARCLCDRGSQPSFCPPPLGSPQSVQSWRTGAGDGHPSSCRRPGLGTVGFLQACYRSRVSCLSWGLEKTNMTHIFIKKWFLAVQLLVKIRFSWTLEWIFTQRGCLQRLPAKTWTTDHRFLNCYLWLFMSQCGQMEVYQPETPQLNSWLGSCGEGMEVFL